MRNQIARSHRRLLQSAVDRRVYRKRRSAFRVDGRATHSSSGVAPKYQPRMIHPIFCLQSNFPVGFNGFPPPHETRFCYYSIIQKSGPLCWACLPHDNILALLNVCIAKHREQRSLIMREGGGDGGRRTNYNFTTPCAHTHT